MLTAFGRRVWIFCRRPGRRTGLCRRLSAACPRRTADPETGQRSRHCDLGLGWRTCLRRPQPLGAAGEVELLAQCAFVGAQRSIGPQRRRISILAAGVAAFALADAGAGSQRCPTFLMWSQTGLAKAAGATAQSKAVKPRTRSGGRNSAEDARPEGASEKLISRVRRVRNQAPPGSRGRRSRR